jgi:GNAT superfamily N-acetyltransferase
VKRTVRVRALGAGDSSGLAQLLQAYMGEALSTAWGGAADALERDVSAGRVNVLVADETDTLIGFGAWIWSYDLHHCVSGGEALDVYVIRGRRGQGVAVALLAAAAGEVRRVGGTYLKGLVVADRAGRRLYQRLGVCFPGEHCYVSGRAFRELGSLARRPAREIVRSLPAKSWNREP